VVEFDVVVKKAQPVNIPLLCSVNRFVSKN